MKCKVEGCDRECKHYPGKGVCQMHYFRMMRYGTYELTKNGKGKFRHKNAKGYQMLKIPDHPLSMANGCVYEHRKVVYDRYGETLPPCEKCGKKVTWKTAHIDHIDEVVDNNADSNLRVLCRACNVMRSRVHIPEHSHNFQWRNENRHRMVKGPSRFGIRNIHQASTKKWNECRGCAFFSQSNPQAYQAKRKNTSVW